MKMVLEDNEDHKDLKVTVAQRMKNNHTLDRNVPGAIHDVMAEDQNGMVITSVRDRQPTHVTHHPVSVLVTDHTKVKVI